VSQVLKSIGRWMRLLVLRKSTILTEQDGRKDRPKTTYRRLFCDQRLAAAPLLSSEKYRGPRSVRKPIKHTHSDGPMGDACRIALLVDGVANRWRREELRCWGTSRAGTG
jgi:hypothetical protein